jgi:uncharacterized protein (DUF1697 family)
MASYILLLRGVNVGGKQKVPMAALRAMIEREGFGDVATVLQSGNAVFAGVRSKPPQLEKLFADKIASSLKVQTDCFIRTSKEWVDAIAASPFPAEAKADPSHLVMLALSAAPAPARVAALREAIVGRETLAAAGRQLYAYYPDGIGESKLTLPVIEKQLGVRGTGRNWNTVLKLSELAGR